MLPRGKLWCEWCQTFRLSPVYKAVAPHRYDYAAAPYPGQQQPPYAGPWAQQAYGWPPHVQPPPQAPPPPPPPPPPRAGHALGQWIPDDHTDTGWRWSPSNEPAPDWAYHTRAPPLLLTAPDHSKARSLPGHSARPITPRSQPGTWPPVSRLDQPGITPGRGRQSSQSSTRSSTRSIPSPPLPSRHPSRYQAPRPQFRPAALGSRRPAQGGAYGVPAAGRRRMEQQFEQELDQGCMYGGDEEDDDNEAAYEDYDDGSQDLGGLD